MPASGRPHAGLTAIALPNGPRLLLPSPARVPPFAPAKAHSRVGALSAACLGPIVCKSPLQWNAICLGESSDLVADSLSKST